MLGTRCHGTGGTLEVWPGSPPAAARVLKRWMEKQVPGDDAAQAQLPKFPLSRRPWHG